ncbi:MAG: glutathione synthase/RimK-type ligase-like ATP-grasp enzyme [Gammaproteobacteria bacterium]|jgi:glutathione synthase/RimK-type ligase-like ATP-grasp enzyme
MNPLVVVDSPRRWPLKISGTNLVSAYDYLSDAQLAQGVGRKVFNLCRSFRYQAAGYYVSLLAEARGHRPLPSVSVIQDLRLAPVVKLASGGLHELMQANLRRIESDTFELSVYFGRNLSQGHDRLALAVFNAFPAPLLRARFERSRSRRWQLASVRVLGLSEVPDSHRAFLIEQATRYSKRRPRKKKASAAARFDLAILYDPDDPMPPSNSEAIKQLLAAGEELGLGCDLIGRDAYGRIGEYDALLIRDTTSVNHYTYRFSRRASARGMVVVDDPQSILRCTNKVFLAETLARHRVAMPKTLILSRENALSGLRSLGFPCVIKKPDSAFSAGVFRIDAESGLQALLNEQFETTDLLVAQEYVPTEFDWRVGVMGGEPLFVCRYGMAPGHWQIVKRDDKGIHEGESETLLVTDAPVEVVQLAVRAAALMGDGLYGVDLKTVEGKSMVIEVNDNPNIDAGVEDAALGDELYRRIMGHLLRKLESR